MQISRNTTGLLADLAVATDAHGADHCVVVVKGSFVAGPGGVASLAEQHAPFVYCDISTGEPGFSSTAWETDFCRYKPLTDVIVVGKAVAPGRVPATEVAVRLEVQGRSKDAMVFGERRWVSAAGFARMSPPVPFVELPLCWERAFGGDVHNPVGVGLGDEIPNVEDPRALISSQRDRPRPRGFSWIGRSWQPRIAFAGTYDRHWRTQVCPLLPEDFDERYFQAAPADQQFPHFRGGEHIRCVHMADAPVVDFWIPALTVPVHFDFGDRVVHRNGVLDTVVLEPHRCRMHLSWRVSTPLPKQLIRLRDVHVGEAPERHGPVGWRRGKPLFAGLGSYSRWASKNGRSGGRR